MGIRATSAAENEAGFNAGAKRGSSIAASEPGWEYSSNIYNNKDADYDPDLYRAAILQRYLRGEGGLNGDIKNFAGSTDWTVARNAMNRYLSQAGQRKELKGQLAGLGDIQRQEEAGLKSDAERQIGEGVKNTRQNYNNRGLLYGGMRESGEQGVRAQGASALASSIAGVRKDAQNKSDAIKQSIASIGLQSQQQTLQMQQQVMENSMRNAVARQQAIQQLGEGVGYAAGTYFGNRDQNRTGASSPNYNNAAITGGSYRDFGAVA